MAVISFRVDFPSGQRLGPGKVTLLEAIGRTGSITQAAQSLGMSYRRAWLLVESLNQLTRAPVVATAQGGSHGGGAKLTTAGKELVRCYRAMGRAVQRSTAAERRALGRLIRA